jgi:ATP-binding cassette subfamily B protein
MLRRRRIALQHDTSDCGPAALLTVLRMHGQDCSVEYLREQAGTDASGTSVYGLVRAARSLGMHAEAVRGHIGDLATCRFPLIAHVVTREGLLHFIVVKGIRRGRVQVADPAMGHYRMTLDAFAELWKTGVAILVSAPTAAAPEPPSASRWLIGHLLANNIWITQSAFLGTVYAGLGIASAFLLQVMVDKAIPLRDVRQALAVALVFVAVGLIRGGVGWLRQLFGARLFLESGGHVSDSFLGRILYAHSWYFRSRRDGDVASRLNDLVAVNNTLIAHIGGMIIDVLMIVSCLAAMILMSRLVGLAAVAELCLLFAIYTRSFAGIGRMQRRAAAAFARTESSFLDSIRGIDEIKTYSLEAARAKHVQASMDQYLAEAYGIRRKSADLSLFVELASAGLLGFALYYLGNDAIAGHGGAGTLIAMYAILGYALPAVMRLAQSLIVCQQAWISACRIVEALGAKREDLAAGQQPERLSMLELRDAVVRYADGRPLLSIPYLVARRGELIRLQGGNGSGKSTLARVLQQTWAHDPGTYTVDGVPVEQIAPAWLRRQVVVVPKQSHLFSGTVLDNILCSEDAEPAAARLKAFEERGGMRLLASLGLGLDTHVGEGGRTLSSGEQQIVALARSLLRAPAVLVLDEALSAMDVQHRALASDLISRYARDHVVVVIEHDERTGLAYHRRYRLVEDPKARMTLVCEDSAPVAEMMVECV